MSKPKTHVVFILDRSGSMCGSEKPTVSNYNEHVEEIQMRSEEQDIDVSLITFGSTVSEHLWRVPVNQLEKSSVESYSKIINGGTALLDALGYSIDKLLDETESEQDSSYLIITLTDGQENSSKNYSQFEIKQRISELESSERWTFTLLGCDKNYLDRLCNETGLKHSNVAACNMADAGEAIKGGKFMRAANAQYFSKRASGQQVNSNVYSDAAATFGFTSNSNDSIADLDEISIDDDSLVIGTADVFNNTAKSCNYSKREFNVNKTE